MRLLKVFRANWLRNRRHLVTARPSASVLQKSANLRCQLTWPSDQIAGTFPLALKTSLYHRHYDLSGSFLESSAIHHHLCCVVMHRLPQFRGDLSQMETRNWFWRGTFLVSLIRSRPRQESSGCRRKGTFQGCNANSCGTAIRRIPRATEWTPWNSMHICCDCTRAHLRQTNVFLERKQFFHRRSFVQQQTQQVPR